MSLRRLFGADKGDDAPDPTAAPGPPDILRFNMANVQATRRMFFLTAKVLMVSLASNGLLILVVLALQIRDRPEPRYFAVHHDGSLIDMVPLNEEHQPMHYVMQFAADVTRQTYSFGWGTWREQLEDLRPFFTDEAYKLLLQSFSDTRFFEKFEEQRRSSNFLVTHPPVLITEGVNSKGIYTWAFQLKGITTSSQPGTEGTKRSAFEVAVQRADTRLVPGGLLINRSIDLGPQ